MTGHCSNISAENIKATVSQWDFCQQTIHTPPGGAVIRFANASTKIICSAKHEVQSFSLEKCESSEVLCHVTRKLSWHYQRKTLWMPFLSVTVKLIERSYYPKNMFCDATSEMCMRTYLDDMEADSYGNKWISFLFMTHHHAKKKLDTKLKTAEALSILSTDCVSLHSLNNRLDLLRFSFSFITFISVVTFHFFVRGQFTRP